MSISSPAGSPGTVCITGATSGIGRAYAEALAADGYDLILTGRREEQLRHLAGELSDRWKVETEVIIGDLRDRDVSSATAERLSRCESLVMLIHNAGFGHREGFFGESADSLRTMGEVHMQCAVELVRAAYPRIRATAAARAAARTVPPSGIWFSSLAAFLPAPGPAMYTATKAFLVQLARALQPQAVREGVRFQVLCPGFTHTDFHDRLEWSSDARHDRGIVRWMTPEDVVRPSLKALQRRRATGDPVFIPGFANRFIRRMTSLMPWRLYARVVTSKNYL
jgi:uncharacterized protein